MAATNQTSGRTLKLAHFAWVVLMVLMSWEVIHIYFLTYRQFGASPIGYDFAVFHAAAAASMPYDGPAAGWFVNPPPFLLFIRPLALIELWPAYLLFTALTALCYFLAVWRLSNLWVAALSLSSVGVLQALILGQLAIALTIMILIAVTLRPLPMGLIFGVVLVLKPQLLVMAPLILLLRRDWPALLGMALGGGTVLALSAFWQTDLWLEWWRQLPAFQDYILSSETWRVMISWSFYGKLFDLPVYPLFFICALLAAFGAGKVDSEIDLAAYIVAASILVSPYALLHDTAAIVPTCCVGLLRRFDRWSIPQGLIFAGLLVPWSLAAFIISWFLWRPSLRVTRASA